jgi:hypothetical protein
MIFTAAHVAIEQHGGQLGVAKHAGPFAEGEVRGDDDRGSLVEPADEVEQELATGLGERQIAEFIKDDEVHAGQVVGESALATSAGLGLEAIDEIDHVVESAAGAIADAASRGVKNRSRTSPTWFSTCPFSQPDAGVQATGSTR